MTKLQQLEQNARIINGSQEHGSYCECIWCLEAQTQKNMPSQDVQQDMEQEMMAMLEDLPLAIVITRQEDLADAQYTWRCEGAEGKAHSFVDAARQSLQCLIGVSTVAYV